MDSKNTTTCSAFQTVWETGLLSLLLLLFVFIPASAEEITDDGIRFRREYEILNGKTRNGNEEDLYLDVYISENNPIVYASAEEAAALLEKGNAVLYFGAPWCPWCRNIVPVLLESARESGIEKVYYVDVTNERDQYDWFSGRLVRSVPGSEGYFLLLHVLDAYLSPYQITDDEGQLEDTGEKRLLIPFIAVVRDDVISWAKLITYPLAEGQTKYDAMTEGQRLALKTDLCSILLQ